MNRVQYRLVPLESGKQFAANAQPIVSIPAGGTFDLVLAVKDLRPNGTYIDGTRTKRLPRGVFSAYCNITIDPTVLAVAGVGFGPLFPNKRVYQELGPDLMTCGAFQHVVIGMYSAPEAEVLRLKMKSVSGPIDTMLGLNMHGLEHPDLDTNVFGLEFNLAESLNLPGEKSYVPPDEIALVSVAKFDVV